MPRMPASTSLGWSTLTRSFPIRQQLHRTTEGCRRASGS